ncbi:synaptotagmin-12-like [Argiope bruennichi]|uniref:synaptotagmin-12-like n=1 Tax=Argiope bruennichi TaxID=94029 RepID=UPI002494905D|nr:synaptotagmin-12-like [Argiope bruennichi]XP_055932704.1 synaptotagmin-12-like [Argiope bruennichi]
MQEWVLVLTVLGVTVGLIFIAVVLWKLLGGWSRIHSCVKGDREETAQLTKNGHFGANGYVSSESDIALDLSGNYKHYDNVGNDLKLVTGVESKETNNHIISSPSPTTKANGNALQLDTVDENDQEDTLFLEKSNTPTLKRAISCDSIMSNSSVAAEALESPHHCGELELGLEYDTETEDLIVIINRARDLVGPIPNSVVDSYIKVFLLPDRSTNMQTRIQRKSNNPVFKERFLFGVDEADVPHRSLLCTVFTCDKYTNSMLGECEVKLSDVDLAQPYMGWFPIVDSNQGPAELGDIMFSLSYLPTAERLTVVIVKGRNLRWEKSANSAEFNPFVKVYLLQNGNKFAKKKTSVKKNERDPNFNEAMIFNVPSNALQNMQLRITVADAQSSGKCPAVGHVFVGPYCKGKSLSHWNQMMSSLRKPVAMWHPLRKMPEF